VALPVVVIESSFDRTGDVIRWGVLVAFPAMNTIRSQTFIAVALAIVLVSTPPSTQADVLVGANLKKRADAVVGLMSFMLTPDVTTGSLSFSNEPTGNPDVALTTLGGGFTMSQDFPLYLEGTAGYSLHGSGGVAKAFQFDVSIAQLNIDFVFITIALVVEHQRAAQTVHFKGAVFQELEIIARLVFQDGTGDRTGLTALQKPVRYVLEAARTSYIGDMRGALGFDEKKEVCLVAEIP
jgi:hypothetical protein